MKRLYTLLILTLLIGLKAQGQQTYFTPGIPPGSTSFSPTYRFIGTDSLFKLFLANGNRTSQVYTAAQVNSLLGTVLPSQTGNSGKYLTTNGTSASWAALSGSGTVTSVGSGYGLLGGPITTTGTLLVDTNKIALSDDRILSGMVTTASGTTATTTAGSYRLGGTVYAIGSTNTTIPAQDATLSRFSVIYATTSSALAVINGTLAANPDVPSIPSGTLLVSTILITPTGINPNPPPNGKINANNGLTLKNGVIQLGGPLLHSTNIGFSSNAPLTFTDQANNNGMNINSSGWNTLYQSGSNTTQSIVGTSQLLSTIQIGSNQTGFNTDYTNGNRILDGIFNRGVTFAANYTTNQRLQRLSVPSVNTVIALADSIKGTISIPVGANPTATAGTTAVNGSATTFMRSDAAPKVDSTVFQTIANFFPKGDTRYYKSSNPSGYISGNQTISFAPTGDVTGSTTGTTSLAPALSIGVGKVTNAMLAGSIDLTSKVTGLLPVANGGTGTASPGIIAGTNITVSGTWPNQTVNASGSGVTTVGTFSGSSQTNGANISGSTITFGPADGTNPGMVSTGTQTIAGTKTFNSDITVNTITVGLGSNSVATSTAVGYQSLHSPTNSGVGNTGIGYQALFSNTTGVANTAIGRASLFSNTTGQSNTAIGYNSLGSNTTTNNNTAIGFNSLYNNTAANNTAIGISSLFSNTTGTPNTAIGYQSLTGNTTGSDNIAIGYNTLRNNTTGTNNSGIGDNSLYNTTTGNNNTAISSNSLTGNTTGSNNVAIGYTTLNTNFIGSNNTGIGSYALSNTATAVYTANLGTITGGSGYTNGTYTNISMTYISGPTISLMPKATIVVSGGAVTAVTITSPGINVTASGTVLSAAASTIGGTGSGFSVPINSIVTGSNNTGIGYGAGQNITGGTIPNYTPSNSIFLGYNTQAQADQQTNQIVIGYNTVGNGSNTTTIGNNSTTQTYIYGAMSSAEVQTSVSGSTSGSAAFSEPWIGAFNKRVVVYLNALNGTASYTFPTSFTNIPQIITTNGPAAAIVTSLSTTAMTCTGATTTGFIILEGY